MDFFDFGNGNLPRQYDARRALFLPERRGFGVQRVRLLRNTHGQIGREASYSGRCYLSDFLDGRASNRGACVQACRWNYRIARGDGGDWYDLETDGKGTYVMNGDKGRRRAV